MTGTSITVWTTVGFGAGLLMTQATISLVNAHRRRTIERVLLAVTTAATFAAVAARYSTMTELLAYSVFAAVGVQLAVIDAATCTLPRVLIWPTWTMVSCVFATAAFVDGDITQLSRVAAGSAVLVAFYLAIALASHGGVGAGDVRAAGLVGSVLGWHCWTTILTGTVLAFLVTAVLAIALGSARRERQAAVPHGPGLLAAAFVALLLG